MTETIHEFSPESSWNGVNCAVYTKADHGRDEVRVSFLIDGKEIGWTYYNRDQMDGLIRLLSKARDELPEG